MAKKRKLEAYATYGIGQLLFGRYLAAPGEQGILLAALGHFREHLLKSRFKVREGAALHV